MLAQGIEAIAAHDQALVERLLAALDGSPYHLVSPREAGERAAIVVVSAGDSSRNEQIQRQLDAAGIDVALRAGNIRLSPHLYNTFTEVDLASATLLRASSTGVAR